MICVEDSEVCLIGESSSASSFDQSRSMEVMDLTTDEDLAFGFIAKEGEGAFSPCPRPAGDLSLIMRELN
ncbi:unnamed protein product [Rodentolepis nana]|uniref:Uncharacterized protein n=1 Tax=Rodentolepis nana TaxID=102285 RepID=A0A3P7SI92_RODNA|nr:unnamed protein product [Rodentolepis nana]